MTSKKQNQINDLVVELFWEYQRMSSNGQENLDKLAKVCGVLTWAEADDIINENEREYISTPPLEEIR